MSIVSQLLRTKGNEVWSVGPDDSIYDALELMAEKNIGAVLVISDDKVVGILSERDYARKVVLKGKSSRHTPAHEIMTANVVFVRHDQSVEDCMGLMTSRRIRHLPVLGADDELVGLISIGDVVKAIITDQEVMISHLADYIKGKA